MEEQIQLRTENINKFMKSYSVFIDSSLRNIFDTEARPKEPNGTSKINMNLMKHTFKSFSDCLQIYKESEKDLTGINTFIFIREAILNTYNLVEKPEGFAVLPYSQQVLGSVNPKFDGITSLYKKLLETPLDSDVVDKSKLKLDYSKNQVAKLIKIDEKLDKYFISFCQGYTTEFAKIVKSHSNQFEQEEMKNSIKDLVEKYLKDLHLLFPKKLDYLRSIIIVNGYYLVLTSIRNAQIANKMKQENDVKEEEQKQENND